MAFLGFEINYDLIAIQIPFRDTSESPAFVGAEGFGREAGEFVGGFFVEGAALNGLGYFVCHTLFVTETHGVLQE